MGAETERRGFRCAVRADRQATAKTSPLCTVVRRCRRRRPYFVLSFSSFVVFPRTRLSTSNGLVKIIRVTIATLKSQHRHHGATVIFETSTLGKNIILIIIGGEGFFLLFAVIVAGEMLFFFPVLYYNTAVVFRRLSRCLQTAKSPLTKKIVDSWQMDCYRQAKECIEINTGPISTTVVFSRNSNVSGVVSKSKDSAMQLS